MEDKEPIAELEPFKDQGVEAGFNLLAVTSIPTDPEARRALGTMITQHIGSFFDSTLTRADRALWRRDECDERWPEPTKKRIWGALDKTIVGRAETLGWLIYLSPLVQKRMAQWHWEHERGPERFEQLGQAVVLAARVARGDAKLPISEPGLKQAKAQGVSELRRLLKQSKKDFNQRRTPPSYQEVCEWFRTRLEASPRAFPFLKLNTFSLLQYFEHAKQKENGFAKRLALGEIRPGALFDDWGAWSRNLNRDTFRQSISRLPSAKV